MLVTVAWLIGRVQVAILIWGSSFFLLLPWKHFSSVMAINPKSWMKKRQFLSCCIWDYSSFDFLASLQFLSSNGRLLRGWEMTKGFCLKMMTLVKFEWGLFIWRRLVQFIFSTNGRWNMSTRVCVHKGRMAFKDRLPNWSDLFADIFILSTFKELNLFSQQTKKLFSESDCVLSLWFI